MHPNAYIVLFLFIVYILLGKNKQTNKQTNKQANFISTFCCRWRGGRDRWFCPAQLQEVVSAGPDFHCRHHLAWYGDSGLALKLSRCVTSHTLASFPGPSCSGHEVTHTLASFPGPSCSGHEVTHTLANSSCTVNIQAEGAVVIDYSYCTPTHPHIHTYIHTHLHTHTHTHTLTHSHSHSPQASLPPPSMTTSVRPAVREDMILSLEEAPLQRPGSSPSENSP